ncbi:hypothetical protein LPW30_13030 [Ectothiorhodospira variabilis]|nr:hypothetical protein [Ectothiorhodospira variabilis]
MSKNVSIHVRLVADLLEENARLGFLKTLAHYASSLSAAHAENNFMRFYHMLRSTGASELNDKVLINYRSSLNSENEWYLGVIRGFLRRWYKMGFPGVSNDLIRLLDGWRLRGNRKGDAIKRKDPSSGALTDIELQAFNEGAVCAFERNLISLSELAMSLVVSNTGRRPGQISHLKIVDIVEGKNAKDERSYLLNIPRGKQGDGFRAGFKAFAVTEDLWAILSAQARNSIEQTKALLGFDLQEVDRKQIPLFPDLAAMKLVTSPKELRELLGTDKLHIAAAEITDVLQFVAEAGDVVSERTGEPLRINARRFRYTTGTRAAREGFGELVIAELLDHSDTQNAGVYVKNIPEHVKRLDEAIGYQLAPLAQAFAGVLVDSEREAKRGSDPASRVRTEAGHGIGTCGELGFCGANVPVPCYTCMHFQPWMDAPHNEVYQHLISERERLIDVTGDMQVAAVLDRSIIAVAEVIQRCEQRREELAKSGMADYD